MTQRLSMGEERGAKILKTLNTTLFCSLERRQQMKKRKEKAHGCFPVGVDKSNRCEMTYEPRGSAVGEALNLFLSPFTSESDIIISSSVRRPSLSRDGGLTSEACGGEVVGTATITVAVSACCEGQVTYPGRCYLPHTQRRFSLSSIFPCGAQIMHRRTKLGLRASITG